MTFRGTIRVLLGMASAAAVSLVLAGQLGRESQLFDQFNALLPLLLIALGFALASAVGLSDRAVIALALIGLGLGGYQLGRAAIAGTPPVAGPAARVRVLTFSTFYANPQPKALHAMITAERPDVVLLQEADGNVHDEVVSLLPRFHRVKGCSEASCHLVILSRWPARRVRVRFAARGTHIDALMGEVLAPFGTFRVLNVHLPRPYREEAAPTMDNLANTLKGSIHRPLVLGGDFNSATGSFGLARFERQSQLIRQEGYAPTYPANRAVPAFAGIDHLFTDARWSGRGCHRTKAAYSDHHGIVCDLALRPRR